MDRPPEPFGLEGLLPGQNWPLQIEQKIRETNYIILILSPNSIDKQGFVQNGFRLALQAAASQPLNRVFIIPILTTACEVPLFVVGTVKLNDFHWIDYSVDGIDPVIETIRRDFKPSVLPDAEPKRPKTLEAIGSPQIRWKAFVGKLHWRNNIWAEDESIFVSSSGFRWNQADRGDGVYCLEKQTGVVRWAFNSDGDANEILVHDDKIIFGTDGGQLYILHKSSGTLLANRHIGQKIFARPFVLQSEDVNSVFAISHTGMVLRVDLTENRIMQAAQMPFLVRANVSVAADRRSAILFGETGEIVRVLLRPACEFSWEVLARKTYFQPQFHEKRRAAGLVTAPLIDDSSVIGGFVRDTYYLPPPIFRFDIKTRQFLWGEKNEEERARVESFGNLRSQPIQMGNVIVFAPAYTAGIFGASKQSGKILWRVTLGQQLFQQWSSPVAVGENKVLLARPDGILYQVNVAQRRIEWSISLIIDPPENPLDEQRLYPREIVDGGITATPTWDGTYIFVGTTEGTLFCLQNDETKRIA
jgi:outer membrane protein assembly factor BamB